MLNRHADMHSYELEDGQRLRLGKKLGEGGEGAVYKLPGFPDLVAKIYANAIDHAQVAKLRAICGMSSPQLDSACAWPRSLIVRDKQVCGFTMPLLSGGTEIHELFGSASRKKLFPKADWGFLIHVSKNLAAAVDSLHRANIVVGDLNQRNTVVFPDGTVKLWDCDSFQIEKDGKIFYCKVGVPEFTPPELQDCQSFDGVTRSFQHDRFSLAVMIFYILFMGRHPYSGNPIDSRVTSLELQDAIRRRLFAYSPYSRQFGIAPPTNSPPVFELGESLLPHFTKSFQANERCTPGQWYESLNALASQLVRCEINPGHAYPGTKDECPWCAYETAWKVVTFLPTACPPKYVKKFDFEAIVNKVSSYLGELPITIPTFDTSHANYVGKPFPALVPISEELEQEQKHASKQLKSDIEAYNALLISWTPEPRIVAIQAQGSALQQSLADQQQEIARLELELQQHDVRSGAPPVAEELAQATMANPFGIRPLYSKIQAIGQKYRDDVNVQKKLATEQALQLANERFWKDEIQLKFLWEEFKRLSIADEPRKSEHLNSVMNAKSAIEAQQANLSRLKKQVKIARKAYDASRFKRKVVYEIRKMRYQDLLDQEKSIVAKLIGLKRNDAKSLAKKNFFTAEASYRELQHKLSQSIDDYQNQYREIKLMEFLDQFNIERAGVPSISANQVFVLRCQNIETAADLRRRDVSKLKGIPEARAARLNKWRDQLIGCFKWDPARDISAGDLESVKLRLNSEFHLLELTLKKAAKRIEQDYNKCLESAAKKLKKLAIIREQLKQACADLQV